MRRSLFIDLNVVLPFVFFTVLGTENSNLITESQILLKVPPRPPPSIATDPQIDLPRMYKGFLYKIQCQRKPLTYAGINVPLQSTSVI